MKKYLLFLFFIFLQYNNAQTIVAGIVIDDKKEPIPFANIYFKNSTVGVTSDENGKFYLESKKTETVLVISFIGYQTKEITLLSSSNKNLKIVLSDGEALKEVVLVSKPKKHLKKEENPAFPILQKIWKNKKQNGLKLAKSYEYKKYTSLEVGINNLDSLFLKKILKKDYDSIISIVEKDKRKENFVIPIFMSENLEMIYGNNQKNKYKTDKIAERNTGIAQEGIAFDRLSQTFNEINIYDNDFFVLQKTFVSPISSNGYGVYEYVLKDSIVEDGKKYYDIYFFPRTNGDLAFQGSFLVADKTFSIASINMRTTKEINLNLVRNLYIEKKFTAINDSIFLPTLDEYEGDFTLLTKSDKEKGLFVKQRTTFSNFELNKPKEDAFYDDVVTQISAKQFLKEDNYWKENAPLSNTIDTQHKIIKDLQNNKKIKGVNSLVNIASTGYIPLIKNIQMGSLWMLLSRNEVEGNRLRMGLRNFTSKDDRLRINVFGAYGLKDQKWKHGSEIKYLISQKNRIAVGISYMDDFEQLSSKIIQNSELLPRNFGNGALFVRGENFNLTRNKRTSFEADFTINPNFHILTAAINQDMTSADPNQFNIDYINQNGILSDRVQSFSNSLTLVYTPGRIVYGYGVEQKYSLKNFPTFLLRYTHGNKGVLNSDFQYDRVQFSLNKTFALSKFGYFNSIVEGSKLWGTLPLTLLSPVNANQTYGVVAGTFSLLNYYDFVTDAYISGQFEHHFDGFILNRIPLINKLKLRSVIFYRTVFGTISQNNININRSSIKYNAPDQRFYAEYGFGFENIGIGNIRPLRIDFNWRKNYDFDNNLEHPKFGITVGVKADF
jgi:hypothetical protein